MNNYAIFTEYLEDNTVDIIYRIKEFLNNDCGVKDFVIFTNDLITKIPNDIGILDPYYMIGYYGNIIYLNIEDYLQYKESTNATNVLYLENTSSSNIPDRSMLKNTKIISKDTTNNLKWIELYAIR